MTSRSIPTYRTRSSLMRVKVWREYVERVESRGHRFYFSPGTMKYFQSTFYGRPVADAAGNLYAIESQVNPFADDKVVRFLVCKMAPSGRHESFGRGGGALDMLTYEAAKALRARLLETARA